MAGALQGIKVIDLSAIISGPMCCQILADQGAEVIKVEPHGVGDLTRIGGFRVGTISAMYAAANRGKPRSRSTSATPAGRRGAQALVADADVVVQNFRPGAVERMGIGPDELLAVNPKPRLRVDQRVRARRPVLADGVSYDPIIQCGHRPGVDPDEQDIPIPDLVRTLDL